MNKITWNNVEYDILPKHGAEVLCWSRKRGFWVDTFEMQTECPVSFSSQTVEIGYWFSDDYSNDLEYWTYLVPPTQNHNNEHKA